MSIVLTTERVQTPFPTDVLRFLKEHEDKITNGVVRTFARGYAKWLYDCAEGDTSILPGGMSALNRWKTEDGGEYGYRPAEVAFHLEKLNELFYSIMAYAYLRNTGQVSKGEKVLSQDIHLSEEILRGFSCCLGFYVLDCYFATEAPETDKKWFSGLCHLTGDMRNMDVWRPQMNISKSTFVRQVLGAPVASQEPYYNVAFTADTQRAQAKSNYEPPEVPAIQLPNGGGGYQGGFQAGYHYGYQNGHTSGYNLGCKDGYNDCIRDTERVFSKADRVIEAERKRIVAFIKSLRHTLSILETNPLVLEGGTWEAKTQEIHGTNEHLTDEA